MAAARQNMACRDQARPGEDKFDTHFDLSVTLGLQLADRVLQILLNECGVGADRFQRAGNDPLRLVPPCRGEGVFLCIPFRMVVVPVRMMSYILPYDLF